VGYCRPGPRAEANVRIGSNLSFRGDGGKVWNRGAARRVIAGRRVGETKFLPKLGRNLRARSETDGLFFYHFCNTVAETTET